MLQYSALPEAFHDRLRLQKDGFVARPAFPGLTQLSTNLSSSPTLGSPKLPKSPYISSRQTSSPVSVPTPRIKSSADSRRPSSLVSTLEDVLLPGDIVREGHLLQGESIRLVSIGSNPLPEYEEPAKEFEVVRRLGAGSYAVVYLVLEVLYRPPPSEDGHITVGQMDMDDKYRRPSTVYGREYAIKCLSKANLDEEALAAQMSEVTIHQSLRSHPNIVTLHRTLETSSFLLLLLEYVPGEDLFYFLEQARDHYDQDSPNSESSCSSNTPPTPSLLSNLNPSQLLSRTRLRLISSMFSQMCEAVAACHGQQVFHRDIKPENFIVTDGWNTLPDGRSERKVIVKLTDFGLSTTDIESSDMDCGSAPYMSYECRNNIAPTYRPRAADVWSLGIVLINMLYHFNPWTDTAQGACSSFDVYRQQPVNFFMQRFAGMTPNVAHFLAYRVFNILGEDDSARISAADFGVWVRDLPEHFSQPVNPLASATGTSHHKRVTSVSSTTGYPISTSVPPSHRPSSRQATPIIQPRVLAGQPVSRAPSLGPTIVPSRNGVFSSAHDQQLLVEEAEEDVEAELENDNDNDMDLPGMTSRSTSTNKRRKRGARKGKGMVASPSTSHEVVLDSLAVASQSLAREISKASKGSSRQADSVKSARTGFSTESGRSRKGQPFEPVSMYAVPTALLTGSGPSPPPLPALPPAASATAVAVHAPPVKKPSKWKLSFGKASAPSLPLAASPTEEAPSVTPSTVDVGISASPPVMSATASNVTSLLMGLNAPPPTMAAAISQIPIPPIPDDAMAPWPRGRRSRGSPSPNPAREADINQSRNNLRAPSAGHGLTSISTTSLSSTHSRYPTSSPHRSVDPDRERGRWVAPTNFDGDGRSDRAISPASARGRHSQLASSASSVMSTSTGVGSSGNWRNSMSTMSSAGTSTSAFTHYSNSSMRSVSTTATSVSSTSWRTGPSVNKGPNSPVSPTSPAPPRPPGIPKNVKIMGGVPWELDQLPRGQHPNPVGDIFGSPPVRKPRTRKPKDLKLDTINERPLNSAGALKKSPEVPLTDASTSTTDLGGMSSRPSAGGSEDGDWSNAKKVQRSQINALAKMLSALRR